MNNRTAWILAALLFAGVGAYTAVVFPKLPAEIPTHWGITGQPDDWSEKGQACLFMLGMMVGIPLLLQVLSFLSPKGYEVDSWRKTLNIITISVMALAGYLTIAMLQAGLNPKVDFGRYLIGGLMLFFAIIGNWMGKIRKNFWVGVRTPWTLASDEVWNKTHRFAGRLWTAVGAISTVLALSGVSLALVFAIMITAALYPVLYSLIIYRQMNPPNKSTMTAVVLLLCAGLSVQAHSQTPSYESKELSFKGAGGFELKGTLFMPKVSGEKKVAAVLLLPGSGAPDRDGNVGTAYVTNTYKEIAVHLVQQGYAVFRFDKRSVPSSYASQYPKTVEGMADLMVWENFIGDAIEGYRLLRKQEGVDTSRVVIAGHSEGGLITAQIAHDLAKTQEAPKGIMLLAGPGRRIDIAMMDQLELQLGLQIPDLATREQYLDYSRRAIAQIRKDGTLPADNAPPGLDTLFNRATVKLLRSYFTIEPTSFAAAYDGDVFVMNGEFDSQISPTKDAQLLVEAYNKRTKGTCELFIVPKASHMYKQVTGLTDNSTTGPVVQEALNAMTKWLEGHIRG
ncbi:MAG: SdpI family protein [Fimbriimonadaceae bacterium]|nr:SdpI family protein [Fimbriimonadaceae bacterium]